MKKQYSARAALATVAMLAALPAVAHADAKSVQFETPYRTGVIDGQYGWTSAGAAGNGCALYDHKIAKRADFTSAPASFGNQFLRISSGVTQGCFDQTYSVQTDDEAGETDAQSGGMSGGIRRNSFVYQVDVASATPTSGTTNDQHFTISADRGDGSRMTWVEIADQSDGKLSIGVIDYATGRPDAGSGDGFGAERIVAHDLDRTGTYTIRQEIDFVDGTANDVVRTYVNGVLVDTGTTWEDYYRDTDPGNGSRTVDSLDFRTGGAQSAETGKGFLIDNLYERSGDPNGPKGDAGSNGTDGTDGTNGTNGTNGDTGAKGDTGAQGATGAQGTAGSNGLPGQNASSGQAENSNPVAVSAKATTSSKRVVKLRVSCPKAASLCEGYLTVKSGKKTLGRIAYLVRSGKTRTLTFKLSAANYKALQKGKLSKTLSVATFSRDSSGASAESTAKVKLTVPKK